MKINRISEATGSGNAGTFKVPIVLAPQDWKDEQLAPFNNPVYHYTNAELAYEESDGDFLELPISSYEYHPLFFWKLFVLGNFFPTRHKPLGDGIPMPSPGFRKKMLTQKNYLSANLEGLFVNKISTIVSRNKSKKYSSTIVIGHPKALTKYSIKKLEKVILNLKKKNNFKRFCDIDV